MRSVTYSMNVSLDGYIVGPDGGFDWTAPDDCWQKSGGCRVTAKACRPR